MSSLNTTTIKATATATATATTTAIVLDSGFPPFLLTCIQQKKFLVIKDKVRFFRPCDTLEK
jgi:hypothetical protein